MPGADGQLAQLCDEKRIANRVTGRRCVGLSSSLVFTLTPTGIHSSSIDFLSKATITSYNSTGSAHTRSIPRESRKARMTPCCGEAEQYGAGRAGGSPWRDTTHTSNPSTALPCGRGGALKRLTQQRGNGGLSWLHAGVQVCLQVKALSRKLTSSLKTACRAGLLWAGPRAWGSPTVANTKERAQTFHARMLPLSFLLSCPALLPAPLHDGWRLAGSSDRSRQSVDGYLSRCSDCLGTPVYPQGRLRFLFTILGTWKLCTRPIGNHNKEEQSNCAKTLLVLRSSEVC